MGDNLALFGRDLFGDVIMAPTRGPLADRFVVPPFSVLSARDGDWQDRKRAWVGLGIESELGRHASGSYGWQDLADNPRTAESTRKIGAVHDGPSVFDPVLCELHYRWFCPPGGQVLDPFAGGSVRGIVAGALGLDYWGCDLRAEQVAANEEQANAIVTERRPLWVCGDSLDAVPAAPAADYVFSCPPYGDLERYSENPRDLSTMDHHAFVAALGRIVLRCFERLKPDRFATFVVGDFRDKRTGNYRNFVASTTAAFLAAGMELYNEAILVLAVGSLPLRVGKQFDASRKLGKAHQNVLTFVKGDARKAAAACRGPSHVG